MRELIRNARGFVARGWTQCTYARRADRTACTAWDPEATCWCALGALKASSGTDYHKAAGFLTELAGTSIDRWNDAPGRTQAEVLALFDRAIEAA